MHEGKDVRRRRVARAAKRCVAWQGRGGGGAGARRVWGAACLHELVCHQLIAQRVEGRGARARRAVPRAARRRHPGRRDAHAAGVGPRVAASAPQQCACRLRRGRRVGHGAHLFTPATRHTHHLDCRPRRRCCGHRLVCVGARRVSSRLRRSEQVTLAAGGGGGGGGGGG
eukprot:scaffold42555_cov36-Phaeocystis_antarctica.AAC.1